MFNCSREEPVINNESLFQRKGSDSGLILDQSAGIRINRYGFIYKGSESDTAISALINSLINHLNIKVFIILCWLKQIPGKSKVASKVIEKRYEKQRWNIHVKNDYYIALKEICLDDINTWPPLGISPLDGGIVLMLGNYDDTSVLNSIRDDDCMFLAKNRYFVPHRDFLSSLERKKKTILYQVNDDLNNVGIVLAGDVIVDMKVIGNDISIADIFEGESAYKIII